MKRLHDRFFPGEFRFLFGAILLGNGSRDLSSWAKEPLLVEGHFEEFELEC